ncbi:MAG: ABC transporter ATP-binding protein/permease [Nanoarchaeota archaeon]|nr:ABC transporter ATP-binding protein/permease [Nanoarchaeota archaeon]MBU1051225.1 ABC transporter ATP-binding protein/permease [Nanoarchaeota archaeon]MBU1988521.1 ABC transporter ATP-binding protein/permease [Nanoarchaeota archaeon]
MTDRELYKKVNFKENLKKYWKIARPYKWFFVALIFLATTYEVLSLGEKYLFKAILDNGAEFLAGTLERTAFVNILLIVAGVYLGLLLFKLLDHWFRIGLTNILESKMIFDLKKKFFDHIVKLSHSFHTTHKTGSLISRLNRGSNALERLTDFIIFSVAPVILQIVIVSISLFTLDWTSAVLLLITSAAFISYGFIIAKIQKQAHIEANNAEDREKGNIADVLTNIDSIKYYGKEKLIQNRYAKIAEKTRITRLRFWNYGKMFSVGISLIVGIGTFFIFYFPLLRFLDGEITIGTLAFIYSVYIGIIGPLWGFVHSIRGFYISLGDFDALFKYDEIKNDIRDKEKAQKLKVKQGKIEFKNVTFDYYRKAKNKTVHNLNLEIKPGERVALVGHSGSGKTTLVKLLYRLYEVDKGKILIDGKNIREFKQESLRGELSIVPQECILFDDTIYNNILFSKPSAMREEVTKAIKSAQLDKFIKNLPKKENTIVGERGVKLSGGEKQRVSIARAILANKKILVLDEATSSLDSKTEWEIQRALKNLMQNRTSIIIAHRLSTIMHADKIVVMDKGRIAQLGKHRDLIEEKGVYRELWNLQKGGYLGE